MEVTQGIQIQQHQPCVKALLSILDIKVIYCNKAQFCRRTSPSHLYEVKFAKDIALRTRYAQNNDDATDDNNTTAPPPNGVMFSAKIIHGIYTTVPTS